MTQFNRPQTTLY